MPFVHIRLYPRPAEVKKALAEELTQVISKHLKIKDEQTWIVFEDVLKENWSHGGKINP